MKKIIFLGYMGSGKSEIGKTFAQQTNRSYLDLDDIIEKELKMDINTIFSSKGEIYFRQKEHELFIKTIQSPLDCVLSLGGGTPCYANNHLVLQDTNVISIYLKASITTLTQRLLNNRQNRPLLKNLSQDELQEYIAKQLFERSFYYNYCQKTIIVDNKTPEEIVAEVIKLID